MIQSPNMQPQMQQVPQQGTGANAVAINIYNPQAYGSAPAQQAPYAYEQPIYQLPYAPAYSNVNMAQPMAYQQFIPMNNVMNAPQVMPEQQFVAPAPQQMPQSVLAQPIEVAPQAVQVQEAPAIEAPQAAQAQEAPAIEAPQATAAQATEAPAVEIVEPQEATPVVDIDGLVQSLKNVDPEAKAQAINQIAAYAQESPEIALQVVSEPIMQSLVDIVNEDTTALEGPNEQQVAVSEKIAKGEQLTPEENAIAEQLSPRDMANKNRIFALYTLAMIQKLQRDELNQYIESQKANGQEPIAPLNVQDLVGYNDVVNVIKNDVRPEVKVAGIQALEHVLEPQDKEAVEPILAEAQNSEDEAVKGAAAQAMAKFAA